MEVKYDSASPEDIAPIIDMKIEMFREFGYDQYLHENAREIIFEDYSRMYEENMACLLYTSPSPRDKRQSRMPSSA